MWKVKYTTVGLSSCGSRLRKKLRRGTGEEKKKVKVQENGPGASRKNGDSLLTRERIESVGYRGVKNLSNLVRKTARKGNREGVTTLGMNYRFAGLKGIQRLLHRG